MEPARAILRNSFSVVQKDVLNLVTAHSSLDLCLLSQFTERKDMQHYFS